MGEVWHPPQSGHEENDRDVAEKAGGPTGPKP